MRGSAVQALIVDDETPARTKLRRMLGVFSDIEVVGEAADGTAALAIIETLKPDVVFLDVQMPEVDGLGVAASLPDEGPKIVFVTAFDHYAARAFDVDALDYLVKPIEPERLQHTVQRLRSSDRSVARKSAGVPDRLIITDRKQTHIVRCAEIEWLEAADNYVNIHLPGRVLLMRRTLAGLLEDLGPSFVRTHRGSAVAVAAVVSVRSKAKGDAVVVLRDGSEVPCSRQFRTVLSQHLQW